MKNQKYSEKRHEIQGKVIVDQYISQKSSELLKKISFKTSITSNDHSKFTQANTNSNFQTKNQISASQVYFMPLVYQMDEFSGNQMLMIMLSTLIYQSNVMTQLIKKIEEHKLFVDKIQEYMVQLKQSNSKIKKSKTQTNQIISNLKFKGDDITSADFMNIIYPNHHDFKYNLILDPNFPLDKILYREKNFELKIQLIDNNGTFCHNSNKIPIELALYTAQNPPKLVQFNTLGNKLIKGQTQQDLLNGICLFEKLQIKQVTSHYKKGMLFLVAFPKVPTCVTLNDKNLIEYTQIRPLVIDKIIVKAKKMKQKLNINQINIKKNVLEKNIKIEKSESFKQLINNN